MEHGIRIDLLSIGQKFIYRSHEYIKLAITQVNPLIELSVKDGLYAAVHVNSGEIHAFDKQLVEIEEANSLDHSNSQIDLSSNKENQEREEEDV